MPSMFETILSVNVRRDEHSSYVIRGLSGALGRRRFDGYLPLKNGTDGQESDSVSYDRGD